jgi:malonate-semialdehyde dehydrogenase (acetylating)/methylmalonate-semialdehyde dehydrogenase
MPDADMDMATNAIMGAAYGAAGERCMALSVVLAVGDKAADDLCARLEKQIAVLRVGPGLDQTPENEMGPLISSVHRSKVLGYIDSGEHRGEPARRRAWFQC